MRIFADFDGTIAVPDVTDLVLQAFAAPDWEKIEADWLAGAIDAAECMRRQIGLLDADMAALHALLDQIEIDPDFPDFARWCEAEGVKLSIVSDGVDHFIHRILARHSLSGIPVFANALRSHGRRHGLAHPWFNQDCTAQQGVCKCAVTRQTPAPIIFVGDGRSDQCVSQIADIVFAKGKLAEFCNRRNREFIAFSSFADVRREAQALMSRQSHLVAPVTD